MIPKAAQLRQIAKEQKANVVTDDEWREIGNLLSRSANFRQCGIQVPRRSGISPRQWSEEVVTKLRESGYDVEVKTGPGGDPLVVLAKW